MRCLFLTAFIYLGLATILPAQDNSAAKPATADQAANNKSDVQIMQSIRKAVIADKSISMYGKNVTIISKDGKVTLRGPVHTAEESQNIAAKATAVVGQQNVTNMLSVKGN
jgi:osmotically-inducible protein OsmY